MKYALIAAAWLLCVAPAFGTIAIVGTPASTGFSDATSATVALTCANAGDELALLIGGTVNLATGLSVSDSDSQTPTVAQAAGSGDNSAVAAYYIPCSSAVAHTETVSWTSTAYGHLYLIELSGVNITPGDAASGIAAGFSTTATANAVTPSVSGDMALVIAGSDNWSFQSWGGSITNGANSSGTESSAWGYELLSSTSAFTASATIGTSNADWAIATILVKPAASSSCTNSGYEPANGVIAVPNGTSGTFELCGTGGVVTGTPDCSTVKYWQPVGGKCAVN